MIPSFRDVIFVAGDDHQVGVSVVVPRKLDFHLVIVHDLVDRAPSASDQTGMDPGVDLDLLLVDVVQVPDYLQDGVASRFRLVLVTGDGDDMFFRISFPGQVDLYFVFLLDLGDDGPFPADDLGMVVGVDFQRQREGSQLPVSPVGFQFFDPFQQGLFGVFDVQRGSGYFDDVFFYFGRRKFDVNVESAHQFLHAASFLTDYGSVQIVRNVHVYRYRNEVQQRLLSLETVLLFAYKDEKSSDKYGETKIITNL